MTKSFFVVHEHGSRISGRSRMRSCGLYGNLSVPSKVDL